MHKPSKYQIKSRHFITDWKSEISSRVKEAYDKKLKNLNFILFDNLQNQILLFTTLHSLQLSQKENNFRSMFLYAVYVK
jgi:hypothetical protein